MKKYENVELELMLVADVIRTSGEGGEIDPPKDDDYSTDVDWD